MQRTLTQQVALVASGLGGVLVITSVLSLLSLLGVRDTAYHLIERTTPTVDLIGEYNTKVNRVLAEAQAFLSLGEDKDLAEAREGLAQAQIDLTALESSDLFDDSLEAEFATLYARRQNLFTTLQQIITTPPTDAPGIANALDMLEQLEGDIDQLEEDTDSLFARDITSVTARITVQLQQAFVTIGTAFGLFMLMALLVIVQLRRRIVKPLQALAGATNTLSQGNFDTVVQVTNGDEIGSLQQAFNAMTTTMRQQRETLHQQVAQAQSAQGAAESARSELAIQLTTINAQRAVIREMSVPILPIATRTLIMPLVGSLDSIRMQLVQDQALRASEATSVRYLIVDITGVPVVDSHVAQGLIQTIKAVRLLGVEVIMTGIRPEVAQALILLGIDFQVTTRGSLQSGIAYAFQKG